MDIQRTTMKLFLLTAVIAVVFGQDCRVEAQSAPGWLGSAWTYRSTVSVSNNNGTTLTNFQVRVTLGSSFDFSKAKPDASDLRVASADGTTQLRFWIEKWDPTNTIATVWVNVPSIPTSGTTIYLYYGNSGASSASDGATFDFFDDFTPVGSPTKGFYDFGSATTSLVRDQSWENFAPHTLSVVQTNSGGFTYWGYYGLQDSCGGVNLAFSNDLVNWTKNSPGPLFFNGRWPVVTKSGNTFYMIYTKDYCATSYTVLATSTDGTHFTDLKTLVPAQSGLRNQGAWLFQNPVDGLYYMYWYRGDGLTTWKIMARSSSTIQGLDDTSTETLVLQSPVVRAASGVFYSDNTYFLLTEENDSGGSWITNAYSSTTSPVAGYTLLVRNPVLQDGSACAFPYIVGTTLHVYYCKANGPWTVEHRAADLTQRIQFWPFNTTKWNRSGGTWDVIKDTQPNGTIGGILRGNTQAYNQMLYSFYRGGDYVLESYGKQLAGIEWGLGVRVNDPGNLDTAHLYDGGSTNNLLAYSWVNNPGTGWAPLIGQASVGQVNGNTWYKMMIKVHGSAIDVYRDGVLYLQTSDSQFSSGGVATYGEPGTLAEWANIFVRKYATTEPGATVGPATTHLFSSLTLNPATVLGGNSSQGTVTLFAPAPSGGTVVTLASSNTSVATVPSSVTVPAGSTTATFMAGTTSVSAPATVTITANSGLTSITANLTVNPALSLALNPASVVGGNSSQGTITLGSPAPTGGTVIILTSSNTSVASVPSSITVLGGSSTATFAVNTNSVAGSAAVTITATSGTKSTTAVLNVLPLFTPIRVNAGGPAYVDTLGQSWSADTQFAGGATYATTSSIANTSNPALYRDVRYGDNFLYVFSVPNGTYIVNLKFAEPYYSSSGQRIFNVAINGTTVLSNFDIVAAGGAFTAVDRSFSVPVSSGQITIQFSNGLVDQAMINAIEITR